MNQFTDIIPANSDKPCSCCKRIHRTLYLVGGFWMGKNCAQDYKAYQNFGETNRNIWRGYERKLEQIKTMIAG